MKSTLPEEFRRFFWDTSLENIDLKLHEKYVIARLLEWGDLRALKWLFSVYDRKLIASVAESHRELSKQTSKAWSRFLYAS